MTPKSMTPKSMRVVRLKGPGLIEVIDEPRPEAGPGESLVRVGAVGLCGSDLHWFGQGGIGDALLSRPLVLGHEFGGTVEGGPSTAAASPSTRPFLTSRAPGAGRATPTSVHTYGSPATAPPMGPCGST